MIGTLVLVTALETAAFPHGYDPRDHDREPPRIHHAEPVYPVEARQRGDEGSVTFRLYIDDEGKVTNAGRIDGREPFTSAAEAAVRQWRYPRALPAGRRAFKVLVMFRLAHERLRGVSTKTLLDRLEDGDVKDRQEASGELAERYHAILPDVIAELNDRGSPRRCAAARMLAGRGSEAKAALPGLIALFREAAARGQANGGCGAVGSLLERIDPASFAAELARVIRRTDANACRLLLSEALQLNDSVPEPVFTALAMEGCREAAAAVLRRTRDRDALPHLLPAMRSSSAAVRRDVTAALGNVVRVSPAHPEGGTEALALILGALSDPDAAVRSSAASTVAEIGPGAAAAIPMLTEMLDDPDRNARWSAVRALAAMGPFARASGPALLRLRADRASWPPGPLGDPQIDEHVDYAIEATGASQEPGLEAEQEEIYAEVLARAVETWRKERSPPMEVALTVGRHPASPPLLAMLAPLGVKFDTGRHARGRPTNLEEINFIRPSTAAVTVTVSESMSGWGTRFFLRRSDGKWTVVGSEPGAIHN